MTSAIGSTVPAGRRPGPVTDPVRILLVDTDAASASALGRAIDIDPELAVVGVCRDPRRVGAEAERCRPDLIAIRLGLDDERCVSVLASLAASTTEACVVVLGAASALHPTRGAAAAKNRIRTVAETNLGLAPAPQLAPADRRLH